MKIYSIADVKAHNNEKDGVWLAIDGKVYDVSKFTKHPGQFDILLKNAGKDVSKLFHTIHDDEVLTSTAKKFYIGELDKNDTDSDPNFEVPNQLVESDVPGYYYLLPITIALVSFYFMFFFHD